VGTPALQQASAVIPIKAAGQGERRYKNPQAEIKKRKSTIEKRKSKSENRKSKIARACYCASDLILSQLEGEISGLLRRSATP
jgi:F0F1-type ATP synthase assembly protein I